MARDTSQCVECSLVCIFLLDLVPGFLFIVLSQNGHQATESDDSAHQPDFPVASKQSPDSGDAVRELQPAN